MQYWPDRPAERTVRVSLTHNAAKIRELPCVDNCDVANPSTSNTQVLTRFGFNLLRGMRVGFHMLVAYLQEPSNSRPLSELLVTPAMAVSTCTDEQQRVD